MEIIFSKNSYHIETSQLICNANQLSGFYMIIEIYDYNYNFYWKLFSNRLYLLGASFSNVHQKFINLVFRVSCIFDIGPLERRYQKPSSDITKARSPGTRLEIYFPGEETLNMSSKFTFVSS